MRYFCLFAVFIACVASLSAANERPMMRDFVGLNGHYHFKSELYRPVCRLVRNYHNINWDVDAPGDPITFPVCVNKVNWDSLYSKWRDGGFETNVCLMFGSFGAGNADYRALWSDQLDWAEEYGYAVAKGLSENSLAGSIEIGNEPGEAFGDTLYRQIFQRVAQGIRRADPALKILTCTAHAAPADKYHKSLDESFGAAAMRPLYDVISVHVYSEKDESDQAHPWERSYPEDPQIDYLQRVDDTIAWRDRHAPEKEVWITEFGYDACSEAAMRERSGWFEKLGWTGQTELQQAQWLVRSLLCFSARDVERAYIYYYDDKDKASVHAASGLTRDFQPKPAYWAVRQLQNVLGEYRFNRKLREEVGALYAYEFIHEAGHPIWVLWSPTGSGRSEAVHLRQLPSHPKSVRRMSFAETGEEEVPYELDGSGLRLEVGESPVYLIF